MIIPSKKYQICKTCVLDTNIKTIKFNDNGICVYCDNFEKKIRPFLDYNLLNSKDWFKNLKHQLYRDKKKYLNQYDCLVGLSGGVDSSYVVYYLKKHLNLNPLLLHVDTGWNNKTAVSNIENLVDKLELDLHTIVIDWNEMKDLTLSFFQSQVPTIDTVQDHAIWAGMYNFAKDNNIKNILTGGNLYTESVREPIYWAYHATDLLHIRDIHNKFGKMKLEKFPLCDIFTYQIIYKYFYKIKTHQPLNHLKFIKKEAIETLSREVGWRDYGGKHHESNFTKFIEGYWMTSKHDIDKRRVHLSSLIHSNQLERQEALEILSLPSYSKDEISKDFKYVASKLGLSVEDLQNIYKMPNKLHTDYKSRDFILRLAINIKRIIGSEKRLFI